MKKNNKKHIDIAKILCYNCKGRQTELCARPKQYVCEDCEQIAEELLKIIAEEKIIVLQKFNNIILKNLLANIRPGEKEILEDFKDFMDECLREVLTNIIEGD